MAKKILELLGTASMAGRSRANTKIDQRVIETSQPGSRSIAKWNLGNKNHDAKGVDARASHRWKALAELSLKQASNFENEKNLNPQDGSKFR